MSDPQRTLTDDDVKEIVKQLKTQLVSDFYGEVGRGVWFWCKKVIMGLLMLLALYGIAQQSGISITQHMKQG